MAIQRRGLVWESTVDITAAQLHALSSTPVELAPAPGAGRILFPDTITFLYLPGAVGFSSEGTSPGTINARWEGSDTISLPNVATVLRNTASKFYVFPAAELTTRDIGAYAGARLLGFSTADNVGGAIATVTIANGGSGYSVDDTGTVDPSNIGTASYRVATIGAAGLVTSVEITSAGYGYVVDTGLETDTNGLGTGLTLNITAITRGNGSVRMVTRYRTMRAT